MIILIDVEKAFNIIYPLMIKALQKVGTEGTYLNIINAIYNKSTANIILHAEKLKDSLFNNGTGKLDSYKKKKKKRHVLNIKHKNKLKMN